MKAVILAGGRATRLRPLTASTQKCLLPVHGTPIIDYQLAALHACGVTDVAVVTGYCAEQVHEHLKNHIPSITFIDNPDYENTNNAYGLSLARSFVENDPDGFLVVNSDIIFTPEMLRLLINAPSRDAIVVERNPDLSNDMVKVDMDGIQIKEMTKTLAPERVVAQALGPVKFSQKGGKAYLDFIAGEKNNWLFYTLSDYAKENEFHGVENPGYVWAEMDTPEDLAEAHTRISPTFMKEKYGKQ